MAAILFRCAAGCSTDKSCAEFNKASRRSIRAVLRDALGYDAFALASKQYWQCRQCGEALDKANAALRRATVEEKLCAACGSLLGSEIPLSRRYIKNTSSRPHRRTCAYCRRGTALGGARLHAQVWCQHISMTCHAPVAFIRESRLPQHRLLINVLTTCWQSILPMLWYQCKFPRNRRSRNSLPKPKLSEKLSLPRNLQPAWVCGDCRKTHPFMFASCDGCLATYTRHAASCCKMGHSILDYQP